MGEQREAWSGSGSDRETPGVIRTAAPSVSLQNGRSFPRSAPAGGVKPMSQPDPPLVELLRRTALGDEEAFTQLYHATSRRVYGLALRILRDPTSAEDAALEAYTSVWRHAASFDSRRGRPMTWILTVTRSKAIDLLRARSRRVEHPLGLAGAPID